MSRRYKIKHALRTAMAHADALLKTPITPPALVGATYDVEITVYAQRDAVGGNKVWVHTPAPPMATAQILAAALQGVAAANGLGIQPAGPPPQEG